MSIHETEHLDLDDDGDVYFARLDGEAYEDRPRLGNVETDIQWWPSRLGPVPHWFNEETAELFRVWDEWQAESKAERDLIEIEYQQSRVA